MTQQEHNNDNAFFPPLFAVLRSITAMFRENRTLRAENAEAKEFRVEAVKLADDYLRLNGQNAELRETLAMARRCLDSGAIPDLEFQSLYECTLTAIDAALQKEPNNG